MLSPQRCASVRYKSRPAALMPFRDDTNLVAFRYETTQQAEPPIPIPPPKSHLRYQRAEAQAHARAPEAQAQAQVQAQAAAACAPSCILEAGSVAPPVIVPPPPPPPTGPLPLPPTDEHPALRTDTIHDPKRDSGHAPTTSSQARTFYEESSEDEDPFPYERIKSFQRTKIVQTSLYLENENANGGRSSSSTNNSNSQSSIPLPSLGSSGADTASPTSPTTPPPNFPDSSSSASFFSRRPFSFRSSRSSMKSTRRLKKKHQPQAVAVVGALDNDGIKTPDPLPNGAKTATNSPLADVAPPRNGDEQRCSDRARPSYSPKLTNASAPDGDDFAEFVQQISFSKRGSIMLGGKRPSIHATTMSNDSGVAQHGRVKEQRPPRVFPLAPSPMPKSQVHGAVSSTIVASNASSQYPISGRVTPPPPPPPPALHADAPATPRSLQHPPSIRLIPVDVERESQKVRSLYEPGKKLRWEDGGRVLSFGEKLEPTVEVPSDVDENAYGFLDYPASRILRSY